jgi:hypothetical protein
METTEVKTEQELPVVDEVKEIPPSTENLSPEKKKRKKSRKIPRVKGEKKAF